MILEDHSMYLYKPGGCTGFKYDADNCCWGLGEQKNTRFKSSMRDNETIIRFGEQEMWEAAAALSYGIVLHKIYPYILK